jgi:hypothetical protein
MAMTRTLPTVPRTTPRIEADGEGEEEIEGDGDEPRESDDRGVAVQECQSNSSSEISKKNFEN